MPRALSNALRKDPRPAGSDLSRFLLVHGSVHEIHPALLAGVALVGDARQYLAARRVGELGHECHLASRRDQRARATGADIGCVHVEVEDPRLDAQHVGAGVVRDLVGAALLQLLGELFLDDPGHVRPDPLALFAAQLDGAAGARWILRLAEFDLDGIELDPLVGGKRRAGPHIGEVDVLDLGLLQAALAQRLFDLLRCGRRVRQGDRQSEQASRLEHVGHRHGFLPFLGRRSHHRERVGYRRA